MEADAFSLLVGGSVRFDRKRFSKDIETLSKPKTEPGPKSTPDLGASTSEKRV